MDEKAFYIPSHLDDQPRMFIWELDEFMLLAAPIGLGMFIQQIVIGVILGVFLSQQLKKIKLGAGRSIVMHALYWNTPSDWIFKMTRTPPSYMREFIG